MSNGHFGTHIKFKWIHPSIEVVRFKRFQSHYIDRGDKIWGFSLSIVEIYIIHCPFIGESSLRDSSVVKLVWPNGCLIYVISFTFSPFLLTCMPANAL